MNAPSLGELTDQALGLSAGDRLSLALRMWESLSDDERAEAAPVDVEAIAEARRRDDELSAGTVQGRTHDEVMAAARRSLRCE